MTEIVYLHFTYRQNMNKNPFLETLVVSYVRWIKRDVPPGKDLQAGDYYDVEAEDSTRLYHRPEMREVIMNLPAPALRLFMYIAYHLRDDATSIKLDEKHIAKYFQCSDRTVDRMKHELIAAAIIAKKEQNEYWTNPRYLAPKSRIYLYPGQAMQVALRREQ
jgi:hypothetical protein